MNRRHIQREQRLISNRILVRQALGLDGFDANGTLSQEALAAFCADMPKVQVLKAHYNQLPGGKKLIDE